MPKENAIITQESTEIVLRKATNIMNITNKILKNSKKELVANPDVMMINGLMWQKETVTENMTWDDAIEYAKNLRLGGYDDWRLPTKEELCEIVINCEGILLTDKILDENERGVIIDKNIENKSYQSCYKGKGFQSSTYWSSTITSKKENYSSIFQCYFELGAGFSSVNDSIGFVRCVRG